MVSLYAGDWGTFLRWRSTVFLACLLIGSAQVATAQTELEQARRSLQGVDGFYLSLNLEGPGAMLADEALKITTLEDVLALRLVEAGVTVLTDAGISATERVPYLHIHINMMEVGQGQIPFAIEVRFFQAVRLVRDPWLVTVAATWESSLVGMTYPNQIALIAEAAAGLVDEFAEDLRRVNP
jgi:hypothetical protein